MNLPLAAAILATGLVLAAAGTPAHAQPASAPSAADGARSAGALADMMAARLKRQCDAARSAANRAASPQDRALLDDDANLACECLPARVAAALGPDRDARLDPAQFLARLRGALDACGARGIRRSVARACERGFDPTTTASAPAPGPLQQARCACMRDGLARLDDAALARDAEDTYRQAGERARARAAGASEPGFAPGAMQRLADACAAQDADAPPPVPAR